MQGPRCPTSSFAWGQRLVRIAAMFLLVDRAMDAADGPVEAWLAEDLELRER